MVKLSSCCSSPIVVTSTGIWCSWCLLPTAPITTAKWKNIVLSIAMVFIFFPSDLLYSEVEFTDKSSLSPPVKQDIPLHRDSILKFLTENGAVCPSIALSQILLESGHLTSSLTYTHHNIAGIKNHSRKYSKGIVDGYSRYDSYKDCLLDLIDIQKKYLKSIDRSYAEDTLYIEKLKKIK